MGEEEMKLVQAVAAVDALITAIGARENHSPRALAVARTQFETAFLWAANAREAEGLLDG